MGFGFYLRRFLAMLVGTFVLLTAVYLLRGRGWTTSLEQAGTWSSITAVVYVAAMYARARRCARCRGE